ncbi:MAG: ribosome-associated translation inhibitor RaiA [Oscillospiraceae bacterium]|nr:ribosome-associated translation inhibitor RaiA [Oscillospiraceae bacterium]
MKMTVSSKKLHIGQSFTDYADEKLSKKLERFFGEVAEAKITLSTIRENVVVELTVRHNSLVFRAEQQASDKNDALDACIDKIIRQIRKNKTKIEKSLSQTTSPMLLENTFDGYELTADEDSPYNVSRTKRLVLTPMNVEEAILQMNLIGHDFFMFKNGDTGEINLLYRREDGDYAVIEAVN